MLNEFKQYLLGIGKSENTALNYCDKVKLYFKWCLDSFGSEPQQLYKEGAEKYSLGLTKFQALAKEAKAVYKIDGIALVNCEIFEKFLETFREC